MPKDMNYPCVPNESKGEILFDWSENHIHEYRHYGTPWIIRIQRVEDNSAIAFITFRDLFSNIEIAIPPNVRIRDELAEKDVPPYPYGNCFRVSPFTNFCMLIHSCVPALRIVKQSPPYFSIITPAANVTFTFIRQSKPQDKMHWQQTGTSKTPEEEEEENHRRLALLKAEPHWDKLEETFPAKAPPPTIRPHPDKPKDSVFSF